MKTYIIEQKIAPLANQYRIFGSDENGNKAELVAFAHQKRFAFKEQVDFFTDEARADLAVSIKAEKVMDIHGKFFVTDPSGKTLGALRKVFGASFFRSTWEILDNDDRAVARVTERSLPLAIVRRIWGIVPYLGDIPFLFKYHFVFLQPSNQKALADYIKVTRFRDHYRLDIHDEALLKKVGWQTLVGQAVFLDALQGR